MSASRSVAWLAVLMLVSVSGGRGTAAAASGHSVAIRCGRHCGSSQTMQDDQQYLQGSPPHTKEVIKA